MKSEVKFLVIFMVGIVVGIVVGVRCAGPTPEPTTTIIMVTDEVDVYQLFTEGNVQGYRIVDHATCVVCWYVDGYNKGGVSCLLVKETTLDAGCE